METKLLLKTKKGISVAIEDYGYKSEKEFIEDALWHRILELKRAEFLTRVKEIKERIKKRGFTEKEILKDFEKFSHSK